MLKAAQFYIEQGLSVIAVGDSKRALFSWKEYQVNFIPPAELSTQFNHPKCHGIAVICGQVSGNLEVIDVDTKYDLTGTLWDRLQEEIKSLLPKLYIVKTKSGGYHLYYRCEVIEGNQKLAMRRSTDDERRDNPNVKSIVLIETRGEAGYVIAPPTPGYEKQSDFIIPVLSIDERDALLTAARSFNEVFEELRPDTRATATSTSYQKTPWDDYNERCDVISLLEKHGWSYVATQGDRVLMKRPGKTDQKSSGDYHKGLNLFKVFSSSTQFELLKGYKPFAIYTVLEHGGDFSSAAKQLIADGFGEVGVMGAYGGKVLKSLGMGVPREKIVQELLQGGNLSAKDAEGIIDNIEDINGLEILTFWEVVFTKSRKTINVLRYKLIEFLYKEGFHLFFYDKNTTIYRLVQQKDGFVYDITFETIKKYVSVYINSLPDKFDSITPPELLEVIMKGADTYFGKGLIEFLKARPIDILKDTPDAAFFTFRNGIVKVSKDGPTFHSYGEIGKPVWRSQVIDFDVDIDKLDDGSMTEFADFIHKISGEQDEYLISLIGYLLHRYKDPARPFAVILAEQTEDEKKGGGTGKGILVKALSYMLNIERVDGKNFKLDKNFAFQRVGLDTNIVAIEDVRKSVDFEGFYSIITEGMTVERKNKDEFFIPYKDSPKVLFTTNYTITSVGGHGKRRQRVFEFTNYFHSGYSPMDHYGHKLFDDWDADEWNRFYNLMFLCVTHYLQQGVKNIENSPAMHRKHIRLNFTIEFLEWWDSYVEDAGKEFKAFRDIYSAFLLSNNLERKDYSQKRFRFGIDECCERFGYQLHTSKTGYEKILEYRFSKLG